MSNNITPPPELVREWYQEANLSGSPYEDSFPNIAYELHIATRAAQWGADQELEACCEWLHAEMLLAPIEWGSRLHSARRPKPPSLKEQALMALEDGDTGPGASLTATEVSIIRRALEQLTDD